ncbi:MAG TPA: ABC transporter permease subunit [Humisphaera sp.]|jgi:NitT/TauT family transport system permease protein|nr:ABC transporter permease subunit [Humisphaera sp.]
MPLILFHTKRVREALRTPTGLLADLAFLAVAASVVGLLVLMTKQASAPFKQTTVISLSLLSLPKYTMLSLCRGFAAYFLSLVFTLVYGTIAAHNHRAEKIMIPALDVLQAIPVLGFLPGVVIAMVSLFPTRELGLEVACVVMIFTAQVWNMTFSFHGSLRGIPQALREVAKIHRFSGWKTFRLLEVPASMIGLVWNSMMSMAGGWFFLTVNEAFKLGDRDYRLPGIGSYMSEAIARKNTLAMLGAIVAMVLMIVAVDQIFWRPIVVWSQRFRMEDTAQSEIQKSWMLDLLRRSRVYASIAGFIERLRRKKIPAIAQPTGALPTASIVPEIPSAPMQYESSGKGHTRQGMIWGPLLKWFIVAAIGVVAVFGCIELVHLLVSLPIVDRTSAPGEFRADWIHVLLALFASFGRTTAAVALGTAWALPVGIMIGLSPKWSTRLQPIIQVVASFPAPMLFPLVTMALVVFKIPFTIGCVALMLLGAQWYILFNVIAGAMAIPGDLKEVGNVYRMSTAEKWKRIYLPCVFPSLVTGLVTAAGGAWNATIVSEYVQIPAGTFAAFGLGSLISKATDNANYPLLAAGVVTMAVFVVLLNRFFWKRVYRLAEDRYALNL